MLHLFGIIWLRELDRIVAAKDGCESWTLDRVLEDRITALELYFHRRLLRISWVQKDGSYVDQVGSFKYLGASDINQFCYPKKELRSRIELARQASLKMRKFFVRSDLSVNLRIRMLRCYIFSAFLYACQSWTLDPVVEDRITALELYFYRRLLRVFWVQNVKNEEVLARMGKQRERLLTFRERKTRYLDAWGGI